MDIQNQMVNQNKYPDLFTTKLQNLYQEQNFMMVLYLNGAYNLATDMLYTEGASKRILEVTVPYAKSAAKPLYAQYIVSGAEVKQEAPIGLSIAACKRCIELNTDRISDILKNPILSDINKEDIKHYKSIQQFVGVGITTDFNTGSSIVAVCVLRKSKTTDNYSLYTYFKYFVMSEQDATLNTTRKERDSILSRVIFDYIYDIINGKYSTSDELPNTIKKDWMLPFREVIQKRLSIIDKTPQDGGRKRYENMTVTELKERAIKRGIKHSQLTKAELILKLRNK